MIIVIGGTGFIGAYLVDELIANGKKVFVTGRNKVVLDHFKNSGIDSCYLDLSDGASFDQLPTNDIEAVVLLGAHLPANVQDYNPQDYIDINITGTLNVLEFCRNNSIDTVISTTSYSDVRTLWIKDQPIDADAPREAMFKGDHAVYSISKNAATDLIVHYSEEYGINGSVFRLPPVYGYGPHSAIYVDGKYYKSGFQVFLEKAIMGEDIEIFGDYTASRDVVYVKDVVQAFVKAISTKNARGVYNITSGISTSLVDQVEDIVKVFGPDDKKSKINLNTAKPNASASYIFDISKATNDFGYTPQYVPFDRLLEDYKAEMLSKKFDFLINSRIKS
ncbi:NAD(P)-dependent oxidoreductase [Sphingobacterium kitahiroshimense]|uniref:NAD-dependent epimerase/dehydratase family protein n=1 Tax=Sphingobacterium sp. B16(2022) TaxID=2914044 RepID=UPI00143A7BFE|nr:NAD(P)-dependent oxidoreductase [Sphingobacterium sp. B16(2022)]NJI75023.1 NAD(P)-dependent oxidoreductase [Sphingobacterium sp. B16(2022)]